MRSILKICLLSFFVVILVLSACSSDLHPMDLGNYLKDLFVSNGVVIHEDDFFEPVEDPYLAYAVMLNLVTSSRSSDERITLSTAEDISEQFMVVKDKLLLDGLYGKIDMHEHYVKGGKIDVFLDAAGCLGISKVVFLPTGSSPDNSGYEANFKSLIKKFNESYPDRVIPFCSIDEADPRAAEIFEEFVKEGAKGLKLIGGHPNFYDEPLNSENMYRVYRKVDQYDIPVLLHASIIGIPGLLEEVDQVYSDFPGITFIQAHYGSSMYTKIELNKCADLLDKHPNLYIDLSMGGGIKRYHYFLQKDLQQIKDFVLTYQDRILFGSDIILGASETKNFDWLYDRIWCDIALHQMAEYTCEFGESEWLHHGFELDKAVLRKLYYENPKKVLGF